MDKFFNEILFFGWDWGPNLIIPLDLNLNKDAEI